MAAPGGAPPMPGMPAGMQMPKMLTVEEARTAIKEIVELFELPENKAKMDAAKAEAGSDMMLIMQKVMPTGLAIQAPILTKYGYSADQMGMMQMFMSMKTHEADPEVKAYADKFKALVIPEGINIPGF